MIALYQWLANRLHEAKDVHPDKASFPDKEEATELASTINKYLGEGLAQLEAQPPTTVHKGKFQQSSRAVERLKLAADRIQRKVDESQRSSRKLQRTTGSTADVAIAGHKGKSE